MNKKNKRKKISRSRKEEAGGRQREGHRRKGNEIED